MLSCSCEWDGDGWWYAPPDDFTTLQTKRRRRCSSCEKLIEIDSACLAFGRYRSPNNWVEENIWGDEVQLADKYLCEWCGEMYFNLESLGYCYMLGDSMKENLEDYWNLTGFKPMEQ